MNRLSVRFCLISIVAAGAPLYAAPKIGSAALVALHFESTDGSFVSRQPRYSISVSGSGFDIRLRNSRQVKLEWIGSSRSAIPEGVDPLPGHSNYYVGDDPSKWSAAKAQFARVKVDSIYPGVDVSVYGAESGIEFDLIVAPGAKTESLQFRVSGSPIAIDGNGDIVASAGGSKIIHHRPRCFQVKDGGTVEVSSHYRMLSNEVVAIELGAFDPTIGLTVDPVISFSTPIGGSLAEGAGALAVDGSGFAYIGGRTCSTDFPVVNASAPAKKGIACGLPGGTDDLFVVKINLTTRAVVYATYFGGSGFDDLADIAADTAGNVYLTGSASGDFPLVNPIASPQRAGLFVTKLNPAGALVYSTFIGGSRTDTGYSIKVDSAGNAYVGGDTNSPDFPALNAFQAPHAGSFNVFVAKLNAAGSALLFSSVIGGSQGDHLNQIALDNSGNILLIGSTNSLDFPVLNTVQTPLPNSNGSSAFLTRLNATATAITFSTYLGDILNGASTIGRGVTADQAGNIYATGSTGALSFPLLNPIQSLDGGFDDCFVTKFTPGGAISFSTALGGAGPQSCHSIAVDSVGRMWVAGEGQSLGTPLVDPIQVEQSPKQAALLMQLAADGSAILFSTGLGSPDGVVYSTRMVLDQSGNVLLAGYANAGFPLVQPLQQFREVDATLTRVTAAIQCTFSVGVPSQQTVPAAGGSGTIAVQTQPGCVWNVLSLGPVDVGGSGTGAGHWATQTGSGQVSYLAPSGGAREVIHELLVAGKRVTVTQQGVACVLDMNPSQSAFTPAGGLGGFLVSSNGAVCNLTATSSAPWLTVVSGSGAVGILEYSVAPNGTGLDRSATIAIGTALTFIVRQAGVYAAVNLTPSSFTASGEASTRLTSITSSGAWKVTSNQTWIHPPPPPQDIGSGNAFFSFELDANPSATTRTGAIVVNGQAFPVTQGPPVVLTFDPPALTIPAGGGSGSIKVLSNTADYPWTAAASSAWISVSGGGYGSGSFTYTVLENIAAITRTTDLQVNNFRLTVTQAAGPGIPPPVRLGLRFVPINPCRLVDTRENLGEFGKPSLTGGAARAFRLPLGRCNIGSAAAYSLNITVVPKGFLGYVTIWPTGAVQPLVSTLNSVDGRVKANAAIVPSGVEGAVSVYATNDTDIVIDINGYFVESDGLAFYPIPPCRAVDTRNPNGQLGGPAIAAAGIRNFPLALSNCNIPNNVRAYSLNATVVPSGPLGYLTLWPTGLDAPLVSTLNAPLGGVVANAAIVVAGGSGLGSISAYASGQTHLVVDINGYFAPVGSPNELRFYPIVPCRLVDTRNPPGLLGGFILPAGERRSFPLVAGGCTILETVRAYSLNATVVPDKALGYLTLWPAAQAQPLVSTLNALDDPIVANAAIVPAGQLGAISAFVTDRTHLILDTNGYFAP